MVESPHIAEGVHPSGERLIRQGIGRQSDSNIVGLDGFGAINSPRKKC